MSWPSTKKNALFLFDWPAKSSAKYVADELVAPAARRVGAFVISHRIERTRIAMIFKTGSVKTVGAALGDDINDCTLVAAVFGPSSYW